MHLPSANAWKCTNITTVWILFISSHVLEIKAYISEHQYVNQSFEIQSLIWNKSVYTNQYQYNEIRHVLINLQVHNRESNDY